MDQKDFLAIHGWVDDILRDHAGSGYLLRVRQDGGKWPISHWISRLVQ